MSRSSTFHPGLCSRTSFNHGQTCCAGSRIYVQKGIYDKFTELFKAATAKLTVG